jgi:hypothetical protein
MVGRFAQSLTLLCAALLGSLALASAPAAKPADSDAPLPPPPAADAMRVGSLGRHPAAADIAWLRTVQYIGAAHSTSFRYEGLAGWVELINTLDPLFETPYYHGSVLLATEGGGEDDAEAILARAEQVFVDERCRDESICPVADPRSKQGLLEGCEPCEELKALGCSWHVPLARAFVAYFGSLEPEVASKHFCDTARRGGPPYTRLSAARMFGQATTCVSIRAELQRMSQAGGTSGGADIVVDRRTQIAEHCEEEALKTANKAYRLRYNKNAQTVEDLLETGTLKTRPWTPNPAWCWRRGEKHFELQECR